MEGKERIHAEIMLKYLDGAGAFYKKTLENMEQELMRLEIESYSLKASIRRERLKLNISSPEDHFNNSKDILNVDPESLDPDCVLIEENISLDVDNSISQNSSEQGDVNKSSKGAKKRMVKKLPTSKAENTKNSQKPVKAAVAAPKTRSSNRQQSKNNSLNKFSTSKTNSSSKYKVNKPSTSTDTSNSSSYYFDPPSTSTGRSSRNTSSLLETESSQSCPSDNVISNINDERYLDPLYLDPSTYVDPSFMEFDD